MGKLQEKLKLLPDSPGVYLMKDSGGRVVYVGKALSLRKRVRSYFGKYPREPKIRAMTEAVKDFDYIGTDSQAEALILECSLIKKHRPRYNVRLRDDKKYPYIKISGDPFPCISITRTLKMDGSRYYGPYASAGALRKTLKLIKKLFMLRSCRRDMSRVSVPCLYYHLGQCSAPCSMKVSKEDYERMVHSACLFLEGKAQELMERLSRDMEKESTLLHFEKAAVIRDRIEALRKIFEEQKMDSMGEENEDYIAYATEGALACVGLFPVREGKVLGQEQFLLEGVENSTPSEILSSFVKQYYMTAPFIPEKIFLTDDIDDKEPIEEYLAGRKGRRVRVSVPKKGRRREIIRRLERNTLLKLKEREILNLTERRKEAMDSLKELLSLGTAPSMIEAFDISQTGGAEPVGSVVRFVEGLPDRSEYRRFKIKSTPTRDDCAMISEVVRRRYRRLLEEKGRLPDVILIDGGAGQVNSACAVMKELGIKDIPVIGLAKQFEEIYLPFNRESIKLPQSSSMLQMLRHIRDEAHRFAVTFHRRIRRRRLREK